MTKILVPQVKVAQGALPCEHTCAAQFRLIDAFCRPRGPPQPLVGRVYGAQYPKFLIRQKSLRSCVPGGWPSRVRVLTNLRRSPKVVRRGIEEITKYIALMRLMSGFAMAQSKSAVGRWKFDPAQSQNAQFKSAHLVVTKDDADGIAWRLNGTGQDGKQIHESFSAQRETEAPVKGVDGEKATWHKDGSFDITTPDGQSVHRTGSLSDDGKTLTVTGTIGGKDVKEVWVKASKRVALSREGHCALFRSHHRLLVRKRNSANATTS